MKKYFCSLFFIICFFSAQAQDIELPAELKPYVLQGYQVMDLVKGDLNSDKLDDYILILKTAGEDTLTFENPDWEAVRPLLIIIRQPNGKLQSVASNTSVVLCKHCGGVMGDPYQGITIKPGEFSIDFYGGSSWRWSVNYTFRYDAVKKNWYLQSHESSSFQSGDPENTTEETIINRTEIGDVLFEKFTPSYNADNSAWKVTAAKTYFYKSPDLQSKPKKTYLVKGNAVVSFKQFKNFIHCSFTNAKGTTTTGFLLKKDLLLMKNGNQKAIQ